MKRKRQGEIPTLYELCLLQIRYVLIERKGNIPKIENIPNHLLCNIICDIQRNTIKHYLDTMCKYVTYDDICDRNICTMCGNQDVVDILDILKCLSNFTN